MVDITIVFMGVISWFINQPTYITGGPHPAGKQPLKIRSATSHPKYAAKIRKSVCFFST
jgi:hypothetical protein